ncbi:MmoB/DmpM family protein [Pseudonocardia sp. WMMC193]|uniref:MmoB/DmpM family protein n=1 Tax=Pseudonocardia sp. WMMC193 TaxID=2911965 RepID=UPI001F374F46|nr:MmoB/DmpM family protein [Pseudonocardia sp. WMMC193]MCF7550854.1 MmoB/DmpM family protein [Pseudonocardia sp. WMMC193]
MSDTTRARVRTCGVDLQDNEQTRALVDAIEADHPEASVRRMPGLVKISTPGELVIRRSTVESHLGRPWDTQEFQLAIVTYSGHIDEWDEDQIRIKWNS